jgi:hypothetical protein
MVDSGGADGTGAQSLIDSSGVGESYAFFSVIHSNGQLEDRLKLQAYCHRP